MPITSFYDLIDTYAALNKIDKAEALHLWYRGNITARDLLEATLEDEGIFGYTEMLVNVIKTLGFQSMKDGKGNPWTLQ